MGEGGRVDPPPLMLTLVQIGPSVSEDAVRQKQTTAQIDMMPLCIVAVFCVVPSQAPCFLAPVSKYESVNCTRRPGNGEEVYMGDSWKVRAKLVDGEQRFVHVLRHQGTTSGQM